MSISSALVAAQGRVADAYTAISNKGGTLPATQNLANMPTAINSIPSGGSTGKYQLLERIKDDNNNEIGTVSGFFTDANDVEYAVVCLDAVYRMKNLDWCSNNGNVTDMPVYNFSNQTSWYEATETATENTQLILDYCTANGYTSSACSHCRSQSFTVDGVTYLGQLPNMKELFDMWSHRTQINQLDTSASSHSSTSFGTIQRQIWSSTQGASGAWCFFNTRGWSSEYGDGCITAVGKTAQVVICTFPVLEIPNS